MRLISYNILDGGEGRADPLAEVIEAQRADVVALVEADDVAIVERIASRMKMDFIYAPGNTKVVALLSRWAIVESVNHASLNPTLEKCLLEAVVRDPLTGDEWPIGVLHLHARAFEEDEARRDREIAIVLEVFARRRAASQPHLLVGDFNSNSPVQQIDPAKLKPTSREAWEKNGNRIPRRVMQSVLDAGYVDSLHAVHPREAEKQGSFTTQHPGQRVDFIFAHGVKATRIADAWIEQDRLAKYASDHFPVGVEINQGV